MKRGPMKKKHENEKEIDLLQYWVPKKKKLHNYLEEGLGYLMKGMGLKQGLSVAKHSFQSDDAKEE